MLLRILRITPLILVMALALPAAAAPLVDSYVEARDQGRLDELDVTTRGYHRDVLLPEFTPKYSQHLRECNQQLEAHQPTPFSFVVAVGAQGEVLRIWSDRSTPIFQCVRAKLMFDRFTPPPRAPFYLFVQMRFAPADTGAGKADKK